MKSKILALLLFALLTLQGIAQTFPTPSATVVTADPDTGEILAPANFLSGNSIPTTTEINGWFADPSTNGSFDASDWRTDLGLVIGTNVQAYDADLADLADGSLTGSKVGTGINGDNITTGTVADARIASSIARDTEVTSAVSALSSVYQPLDSDLTAWAGVNPSNYSTTAAINGWFADPSTNGSFSASAWRTDLGLVIGTNVQAYDADLADLADGSLTGSKVGTGINADNITTGTVAEARIASTIARDSEVTSAVSALSSVYQPLDSVLTATTASYTTTIDSRLANTSGTNTGDQDLSSYATTAAVAAGYQPLDDDLLPWADSSFVSLSSYTPGSPSYANSITFTGADGGFFTFSLEEGTIYSRAPSTAYAGYLNLAFNDGEEFTANRYWWFPDATGEVVVQVSPPATASSTGTAGQIAYDTNYVYVCIATNTWKRAALSTW